MDGIRQDLSMCLMRSRYFPRLPGVVAALHRELIEINKTKRLLVFCPFRCRDRWDLAGDQLKRDVEDWLSPPDPSTNHVFVSDARHDGTAAWFFKSERLKEWNARGSLLWIHGKRMFYEQLTVRLY